MPAVIMCPFSDETRRVPEGHAAAHDGGSTADRHADRTIPVPAINP